MRYLVWSELSVRFLDQWCSCLTLNESGGGGAGVKVGLKVREWVGS